MRHSRWHLDKSPQRGVPAPRAPSIAAALADVNLPARKLRPDKVIDRVHAGCETRRDPGGPGRSLPRADKTTPGLTLPPPR